MATALAVDSWSLRPHHAGGGCRGGPNAGPFPLLIGMSTRPGGNGIEPRGSGAARLQLALVALAAGAVLLTALAPAPAPRLSGRAPAALPARADDGFVTDVAALARALPPDTPVDVVAPPEHQAVSSWYWTMAAFEAPHLVWQSAGGSARAAASWRLMRQDAQHPGREWRCAVCGREWCLWTR